VRRAGVVPVMDGRDERVIEFIPSFGRRAPSLKDEHDVTAQKNAMDAGNGHAEAAGPNQTWPCFETLPRQRHSFEVSD
jgi:hypothetical protein